MLAVALTSMGVARPLQPEPEIDATVGRSSRHGASHRPMRFNRLNRLARRTQPADRQNFVIFSRARSGTTWLISMLNGHPAISCDGELLLTVKNDSALNEFYDDFDRTGLLHTDVKPREKNKKKILSQGFKWFHYEAGIQLFEPFYNWNIDNQTRTGDVARAEGWAAWLLKNRFKVVVFEREDRLARMVSEAKHNLMGDYVCTTEKCVEAHANMKVYLKPEHLVLKLQDDEKIGKKTMSWLNSHGFNRQQVSAHECPHMRHRLCTQRRPLPLRPSPLAQQTLVTYRDLVEDPEGQVKHLYRFLGVDPQKAVRANVTMKMGTAKKLADEIENLQEVEEALRGTKWQNDLYAMRRVHAVR